MTEDVRVVGARRGLVATLRGPKLSETRSGLLCRAPGRRCDFVACVTDGSSRDALIAAAALRDEHERSVHGYSHRPLEKVRPQLGSLGRKKKVIEWLGPLPKSE